MVTVKIKKWGNSVGVIIPRDIVDNLSLALGEEIIIDIKGKQNLLKELFGAIRFKRKTKDILNDVRKDMEGEFI